MAKARRLGPRILVETGEHERSSKLAFQFAEHGIPDRIIRLTGGCGFMSPEDARKMKALEDALVRCYSGHLLFGGTQMRSIRNPDTIVPGITEVAAAVRRRSNKVRLIGVIPKVNDLQSSPHGTVISVTEEPEKPDGGHFTVVHPDQEMAIIVQPSVDKSSIWDQERKRCAEVIGSLLERSWSTLLVVYNGGGVTKREVEHWAELGKSDPRWQVLLIKGSGRIADEFASNSAFLEEHPTIHVAECAEESIEERLRDLLQIA